MRGRRFSWWFSCVALMFGMLPASAWAWWDCSWTARAPIAIARPASALTNYTLEIMLNASDVPGYTWSRLDADLRVIDSDDKTQLTFFVQPRKSTTQVIRLWVLLPSLSAAKTIYVYYGNAAASSASSGSLTWANSSAGSRIWTRQSDGNAIASETAYYAGWNANNDAVTGYSCAISTSVSNINNGGLFGAGTNISWNYTSVLNVSAAQAGTWSIRWGPDAGLGGGLYVDDVPIDEDWNQDLWWNADWTNAAVLQGTITLSAGYHVIRAVGGEGCCDGAQEIDVKAPGGTWKPLASANFSVKGPSCQAALPTRQTVQTPTSTASCGAVHFVITVSAYGLYCLNQSVRVDVVDASNNPVTSYSGTMALSTTTGKGTWTLSSGAGSFADATPDDGAATYQWPGGSSTATFSLSYRSGASPVTVKAVDQSNSTLADDGTQNAIAFSPSGFTVTSAAFTNPAGGVPAFASPQTAGTAFNLYLTAYGQSPTDATCGIITSYAGSKSLKFWSTYANPATGTLQAAINGSAIATSEAAAGTQAVTFTAGQAVVSALYRDAGSLAIAMKDDSTGNPSLSTGIRGSTGTFVSRPAGFVVSNIKRTSDAFANPAATTAGGTVFIAAGRPFTATVTAVESGGAATPNYGKETPAESVKFDASLVLPASGNAPAVSGSPGSFSAGAATGTAFSWSEVGIIKLVPRVADGSFLGSGDFVGAATGNVGRFIPDNFTVALNSPVIGTSCSAGGFSYLGQPLSYTVAPVITATARSFSGGITQNYTATLMRMSNASLTGRSYTPTPASPALDLSGLPATSSDPVIADQTGGVVTLTFGSGSGLKFSRSNVSAPFSANISLSINVIDLDGAAASNPVIFGSGTGMAFSTGSVQRYGRLALRNAVGSELLDLPMPLVTQYYLNSSAGFVNNTDDVCTTAPALAFSNYQAALAAGETCVRDSGSPGTSGLGCSAAAASGSRYYPTAQAGRFNLNLAAPGAGNSGAVTVTATAPAWLQYLWNASSGINSNPSAQAAFGLYPGPGSLIYEREVY
jgi:hypothetical protein